MRTTEAFVLFGFILLVGIVPSPWIYQEIGTEAAISWVVFSIVFVHVVGPGLERLLCRILRLPPPNFI